MRAEPMAARHRRQGSGRGSGSGANAPPHKRFGKSRGPSRRLRPLRTADLDDLPAGRRVLDSVRVRVRVRVRVGVGVGVRVRVRFTASSFLYAR